MRTKSQTLLREFVDAALTFLAAHDLLWEPELFVAEEMRDHARPVAGGSAAWKPIPSTATASDVQELEQAIGNAFPALYVDFLQYRHFYELDDVAGISFITHDVEGWKRGLLDHYFYLSAPGTPIQQGYVMFAYDEALRAICFAVNQRTPDGQDCAVVRVLDVYQDPAPTYLLYDSFFDLLLDLRAAQEQRDAPTR